MKAKEINIAQFKNISEVQKFIDINDHLLDLNDEIVQLWIKYRDYTQDTEEGKKAQWEIDFLLFEIKSDFVFPMVSSSEKGKEYEYPDLNQFDKDKIEYLLHRSNNSNSCFLKATYYHLLWKAPKGIKHLENGKSAIRNYFATIEKYLLILIDSGEKKNIYKVAIYYERLIALCDELKSDIPRLKELTQLLLFNYGISEMYFLNGIVEEMLKFKKIFKQDDFSDILKIYDEKFDVGNIGDSFFWTNYYLPTAIRVAEKIKTDVNPWYNRIGKINLKNAEKETEEKRFFIKQRLHAEAINAFSKAKNIEQKKYAEKLYEELRPKIRLDKYSIDIGEKAQKAFRRVEDAIIKESTEILEKEPKEIYQALALGNYFPSNNSVLEFQKKNKPDIFEFFTTIKFDRNNNLSLPKDKKIDDQAGFYKVYNQGISLITLPYLYHILIEGIYKGILTRYNFIEYLRRNSWIGKPMNKATMDGEEYTEDWLDILAPAITEFFVQVLAWKNSNYYRPSFVLAIDSLTLKFEGILRDFFQTVGITTVVKREHKMQEAYINQLLDNEELKNYFNENDITLFNYLFVSENGQNLRNNIAHCFYFSNDYNLNRILLLIAALLRITKFNYKKVQ
jgi:hypothetical protein